MDEAETALNTCFIVEATVTNAAPGTDEENTTDELKLELTITKDAYMIAILTGSEVDNFERGEFISTGIITYPSDQFCVIWDRGNGDEFWLDGGGDGCEACRDYTINDDELKKTANNYSLPPLPEDNVPYQIYFGVFVYIHNLK